MKLIIFAFFISLFIISCAGESDEKDCTVDGCDTGYHCNEDTKSCDKDCTQVECDGESKICDSISGICVTSCVTSGCSNGEVCNQDSETCQPNCSISGCEDQFHCNSDTGFCDPDCVDEDCTDENEICDPESKSCQTIAEIPCTEDSCGEGTHCNTYTGKCVGGCLDSGCINGMHCNLNTQKCEVDCVTGSCGDQFFCNPDTKSCSEFLEYPEGAYGTEVGDVIKNYTWTNVDGKEISLRKLYSLYHATGYPRAILMVESAGWCQPCRMEAPLLQTLYGDDQLYDGRRKLEIIQFIVQDNDGGEASDSFARGWRDQYNIGFSVIADPTAELDRYNASGSIPFNMIIDISDMTIKNVQNGTDETLSGIKSILGILYNKNGPCAKITCQEHAQCIKYPYNQDPKDEETVGCYCESGYILQTDGTCLPE